jgi:hypothetical protein
MLIICFARGRWIYIISTLLNVFFGFFFVTPTSFWKGLNKLETQAVIFKLKSFQVTLNKALKIVLYKFLLMCALFIPLILIFFLFVFYNCLTAPFTVSELKDFMVFCFVLFIVAYFWMLFIFWEYSDIAIIKLNFSPLKNKFVAICKTIFSAGNLNIYTISKVFSCLLVIICFFYSLDHYHNEEFNALPYDKNSKHITIRLPFELESFDADLLEDESINTSSSSSWAEAFPRLVGANDWYVSAGELTRPVISPNVPVDWEVNTLISELDEARSANIAYQTQLSDLGIVPNIDPVNVYAYGVWADPYMDPLTDDDFYNQARQAEVELSVNLIREELEEEMFEAMRNEDFHLAYHYFCEAFNFIDITVDTSDNTSGQNVTEVGEYLYTHLQAVFGKELDFYRSMYPEFESYLRYVEANMRGYYHYSHYFSDPNEEFWYWNRNWREECEHSEEESENGDWEEISEDGEEENENRVENSEGLN